jgi:hypothetical protein
MNRLLHGLLNSPRYIMLLAVVVALGAGGDPMVRPSSYAPLEDVLSQIELYVKQVESDLEQEADYGGDEQDRVVKSANTLIALAQLLANHDEESPRKQSAAAVVSAAKRVARNAEDFQQAKEAARQLRQSLESQEGGNVAWEPIADLQELMKQVPIVNNRLRLGVTGSRFARLTNQTAGHATTLAAMAQASLFDTDYCLDEEGEMLWRQICADMRDAAAATAVAVRRQDQAAAREGLARLVETCDRCHHAFRD